MEPYTVAVTSCGRFDLLARTLASLLPRLDGPLSRIVIAEDSGDRGVHDVVKSFNGERTKIDVLVNDPPLGQIGSIDRLYAAIDDEWIFHCEDDWEFYSEGFIEPSFALLKEFDHIAMVGLRDLADFIPNYFHPPAIASCGIRHRVGNPEVAGPFAALSFNPGLRRMRDYRIVGPYADFGVAANEVRIARCYLELGYGIAYLAEPAVRHLGDGRHVPDHAKPPGRANRLKRSVRKRFSRLHWKLNPQAHPVRRARRRLEQSGVGLHPPSRNGRGSRPEG